MSVSKLRCYDGKSGSPHGIHFAMSRFSTMHMLRPVLSASCGFLFVAILIGTTGCTPETDGIIWSTDARGTMGSAPRAGTYLLQGSCKNGEDFHGPTVHLRADAPLGFRTNEAQREAIAGTAHYPLSPGREYYWVYQLTASEQAKRGLRDFGIGTLDALAMPIVIPLFLMGALRC